LSKTPITSALGEGERSATGAALQATLVDLIDLSLTAKQAHWNVIGENFRSVHMQLDELVEVARDYTDQVAERAAAIGISPNGKARTVAENTGLPDYPTGWHSTRDVVAAMESTLSGLIHRLRARIDETDKTDLVTQDLLIEASRELEKAHWMWQTQLS
jgi:starvation-inducible DNA-binding protein